MAAIPHGLQLLNSKKGLVWLPYMSKAGGNSGVPFLKRSSFCHTDSKSMFQAFDCLNLGLRLLVEKNIFFEL